MGTPLRFDTLQFASDLQDAGMDEKQTKALAKGLYNSQDRIVENLATKQDVELVEQRLEAKIDKLGAKFDSKFDKLNWMIGTTLALGIAVFVRSFF